MADAEVIPIGTRGKPGRGARSRPSAASRGLASSQPKRANPIPAQIPEAAEPRPNAGAKPTSTKPRSKAKATKAAPKTAKAAPKSAKAAPKTTQAAPKTQAAAKPDRREEQGEPQFLQTKKARVRSVAEAGPATPPPPSGLPLQAIISALIGAAREVFGDQWEPRLAEILAFARRRLTGEYEVDKFGFDAEFTQNYLHAALRPLAEQWFRIEVRGVDNIPAEGGALVVSNHSGTVPMDGLMTMFTVHRETGRFLRPLGADLVFRLPMVAGAARKAGATLACHEDAERMLREGELVGVWPEGFKGIGKPYSERYKLQRFGRGGFVSAAVRTGVPIVPLSVVGAEEIYPLVGDVPALARLLGFPYLPITPFFPWLGPLGMVPLPSKWIIEFGEPIRTDQYDEAAAEDPMLVFEVTDQVRETIQQTLYRLLAERGPIFG